MSIIENTAKNDQRITNVDIPQSVLANVDKPLAPTNVTPIRPINPLPAIFTDDEYVRLLKTRTLDTTDVIDAIEGNLNAASFEYVERTIGELFGLIALDKFLKQCK